MSIEILEGEVGKECYLLILVEGDFNIGSTRLGLLGIGLVRDCDVCGFDLELWLSGATESIRVVSVIIFHHGLLK